MPGISIRPPGVEVIQEFVSSSPSAITPFLPTVYVGPAYQIVDAFDDLGNPQANAFAGTYRDGQGTISYDLPSLIAGVSLVGFEDDIRVFLVQGDVATELNSVNDEVVIIGDGTAAEGFTPGTPDTFEDSAQLFIQNGVEVGDYLRIAYRDEVVDIEITDVPTDTTLELAPSVVTEALAAVDYDIVRNPAQFRFDLAQQANLEFGTDADYIRLTAQLLKTDGTTPGDYIGSLGDLLTLLIDDSPEIASGTDAVVGENIFYSGTLASVTPGTAAFLTDASAGSTLLIGGPADGAALRDVLVVVSDPQLIIESGAGTGLSGQAWSVGTDAGATYDADSGSTLAVGAAPNTLTVTNGNFTTSIPLVGPAPAAPAQTTYVELSSGVYAVTTVTDDDNIVFTGLSVASDALSGENPVIHLEDASGADGETGDDTNFFSLAVDLSTLTAGVEAVSIAGAASAITTVQLDGNNLVLTGANDSAGAAPFASGTDISFEVVPETADLVLSFDPSTGRLTVQLERGAVSPGVTATTITELADAITNGPDPGPADPAYNSAFTDVTDGVVDGAGAVILDYDDLGTYSYDGGSDEEDLLLDADLIGSTTPTAGVYVSYKALRVDISDQKAEGDFSLLFIENQDAREALLGVATPDNPLSLAVFFGLLNSPTTGVWAMSISEVSAAKPFGTLGAYVSAFDFLSPYDVHCIVPLTQDLSVAQALQAHVNALSAPEQKAERLGFFNSVLPAYSNATVIASGTSGNTLEITGTGTPSDAEFSTSVNLDLAGVQPGDILVVTAFSGPDSSPAGVNGTIGPLYGMVLGDDLTSPTNGSATKAGDSFVAIIEGSQLSTDAVGAPDNVENWDSLVDVSWTIYRAGAAISQATDQAETIAELSEGFADRRMYHHWPDLWTADVDGTASLIEGHYLAAAWGGRANEVEPEQGFSTTNVAGGTSLRHGNGYFSKAQLDRIAGGGTWITIQESQNAPLRCRHQLSTDTSSIEKREFSITRVVDYVAKYFRLALDRQVGKFNITQSYLDGLSTTIQGLLRSLQEAGKINRGDLISLEVDDVEPDKINVVIGLEVPYPANYIEITLQV